MSTQPSGETRIVNAPPIPTSNPTTGEFHPSKADVEELVEDRGSDDLAATLLNRVRALLRRVRA